MLRIDREKEDLTSADKQDQRNEIYLKQFNVSDGSLVKDYGKVFDSLNAQTARNSLIRSLGESHLRFQKDEELENMIKWHFSALSPDGQILCSGDFKGYLKQYSYIHYSLYSSLK